MTPSDSGKDHVLHAVSGCHAFVSGAVRGGAGSAFGGAATTGTADSGPARLSGHPLRQGVVAALTVLDRTGDRTPGTEPLGTGGGPILARDFPDVTVMPRSGIWGQQKAWSCGAVVSVDGAVG